MIRLVVDSICDMPRAAIEKYGIHVLPIFVTIEGKSYRDGVDIQLEEVYAVMRRGILPKTSQISAEDTENLYRRILEAGDDIIYLCFSSGMSGTCQLSNLLMNDLRKEFPDRKMTTVDSEGGCGAVGMIALQTARWIAAGMAYEDVLQHMELMIRNIQYTFTLDSLSWLVLGGRLPKSAGDIGDKLQVKPILEIRNKTVHVMRLSRGRKATMKLLVTLMMERIRKFPEQLICVAHSDDPAAAAELEEMIHEALPQSRTYVVTIGSALATHIGIGGSGMFFFTEPIPDYDMLEEDALT